MFYPAVEKLLCLIALDDDLARELKIPSKHAFWRGFIVQDRKTGEISARYRFKYGDGRSNWYELKRVSKVQPPFTLEELAKSSSESIIRTATLMATIYHMDLSNREIVHLHYPPDDNGDTNATLAWLIQQDLAEIKAIGTAAELDKQGLLEKADMIGKLR